MTPTNPSPYLIKAFTIRGLPEQRFQHPFNADAIRYTKAIGDQVGLLRYICDYPRSRQRLICLGEERQLYNWDNIQTFGS